MARKAGFVLASLAVTGLLFWFVHRHYPVQHWLFWRYAGYWLLSVLFAVSCVSLGAAAMQWLYPRGLPMRERWVYAVALGVYGFFLGMFVLGLLRAYGGVSAVLFPIACIGIGARTLKRHWLRPLRRAWGVWRRAPRQWWHTPALAFGALGLLMLYMNILTPGNIAYDARWYHLPIAEYHAVTGGNAPRPEGWVQATLPHLTSFLYTWPMTLPGFNYFDRVLLCAHLEFTLFVLTLAAIPVLVWRLVGGATRLAWVALFLFPGILVYDSTLSGAADHVAAFWAIPLYLALGRALRRLALKPTALLALVISAAALTKYQSAMLIAFPLAAVGLRATFLLVRPSGARREILRSLGVGGGVLLLATTPHWLKNWVWHGDPLYPFLYRHLRPRPWSPDAPYFFETIFKGEQLWVPRGTFTQKLKETLEALPTFAFIPHDWAAHHGNWPVFGFLFTLLALPLLFLRGSRARSTLRIWGLIASTYVGVFVWYWMSHQDRYLQCLVPWMAAVVAAVVGVAWRAGWISRFAVMIPVSAQVVWGGDSYFVGNHAMLHASPLEESIRVLKAGYQKDYRSRFRTFEDIRPIGRHVPESGVVLLHEYHVHAGIMRRVVLDWVGWQFGFSYGRQRSTEDAWQLVRGLGVTHVSWLPGRSSGMDTLAGDLRFFDLVQRGTDKAASAGGWQVAPLRARAPGPRKNGERVLYLGCNGTYRRGVYKLTDLIAYPRASSEAAFPAPEQEFRSEALARVSSEVDFMVTGKCEALPLDARDFQLMATRPDGEQLWLRTQLDTSASTP
ncbi:MAG: hypothetical protein R3B13_12835 [Polyangiaceae bacterium]